MDLARWSQHEEWLRAVTNNDGEEPPPGYKDCHYCTVRKSVGPEMRPQVCQACPYEDAAKADGEELPTSPGERLFLALELAGYPPEAINYKALTIRELKDLAEMRQYNQAKRDTQMMRAMIGGTIKKVVPGG